MKMIDIVGKSEKKQLSYLALAGASTLLLFLDVFFYPGFLNKYVNLNPTNLALTSYALLVILRLAGFNYPQKFARLFILFIIPTILSLGIIFNLVEHYFYTNIIFSYTHLHLQPFKQFALFVTAIGLLGLTKELIFRNQKKAVFSFGILLTCFFIYLKWNAPELFRELDKEDSLSEYASFLLYLGSSVYSGLAAKTLWVKKVNKPILKKLWMTWLIVSCLGFFVIAGEEISWGQRILGIETPETLKEINMQEETTLHNLPIIFEVVYYLYFVLGLYGSSSWLIKYLPGKVNEITLNKILLPVESRWYLVPYFIPIMGYVIWRYGSGLDGSYDEWEEAAELILSLGLMLMFYMSYQRMKRL